MTSVLGPEWHLSADGINIITDNGSLKDYNKVLTTALNTDIKEIGRSAIANELSKDKTSKIVLQIQKIRNISAPKAKEDSQAAPRMLKLSLTDGEGHIQALEIAAINSISRNNTPPGTKILVSNARIVSGFILLSPKNCTVLGGKVPHLVEKWEIAKSIQRNKRGNSPNDDGPPAWVNFGTKIQTATQDGNFKSLGIKNKEATKDNSEFELQRQGAIAEATSGAVRKVFGGRVKQSVQPTTSNQSRNFENGRERPERGKFKGRNAPKEREVEERPSKPSEKVSLFAFLEDKLPLNDNQNTAKNSYTENQINFSRERPYNNAQKSYQNASPYVRKDYKQNSYSKTEKPPVQNRYEKSNQQYQLRQFDKPQSSYSKQDAVNSNKFQPPQTKKNDEVPRQFEKPQSNSYSKQDLVNSNKFQPSLVKKNDEAASNSRASQSNNNIQKDVGDMANNLSKMSINSQFASRSLRQHLNLGSARKSEDTPKRNEDNQGAGMWNVGDECLAKYWEDGKFYNAVVTAITEKTCVVKFKGYGNIEEVLSTDCVPASSGDNKQNFGQNQQRRYDQNNRPYSGSMEFRRKTYK